MGPCQSNNALSEVDNQSLEPVRKYLNGVQDLQVKAAFALDKLYSKGIDGCSVLTSLSVNDQKKIDGFLELNSQVVRRLTLYDKLLATRNALSASWSLKTTNDEINMHKKLGEYYYYEFLGDKKLATEKSLFAIEFAERLENRENLSLDPMDGDSPFEAEKQLHLAVKILSAKPQVVLAEKYFKLHALSWSDVKSEVNFIQTSHPSKGLEIIHLGQTHNVDKALDSKSGTLGIEIALIQFGIYQELKRRNVRVLVSEGSVFSVQQENPYAKLMEKVFQSNFPKGFPDNPKELSKKQIGLLAHYGGAALYEALNPGRVKFVGEDSTKQREYNSHYEPEIKETFAALAKNKFSDVDFDKKLEFLRNGLKMLDATTFTYREISATRAAIEASKNTDSKSVAIVYGTGHDFSDAIRRLNSLSLPLSLERVSFRNTEALRKLDPAHAYDQVVNPIEAVTRVRIFESRLNIFDDRKMFQLDSREELAEHLLPLPNLSAAQYKKLILTVVFSNNANSDADREKFTKKLDELISQRKGPFENSIQK
jgi:hypothetical protein